MKPVKLILCGWGPYKDETVIDFEKLNSSGLFLVRATTFLTVGNTFSLLCAKYPPAAIRAAAMIIINT